jgi:hypothetical protein
VWARLVWVGFLCLATALVACPKDMLDTCFIQIFPTGQCELNRKAIRCDRIPTRVRAMHLPPGFAVLAVDGAPYEAVGTMLASLHENEIKDVFLMPPFLGTTPSASVKHWIRLVVEGLVNHPFQMVMISTDRFETWRETLVVLPASEFGIVDALATARIGQADCLTSQVALPMDLRESEHRLLLFEHADQVTQSCLIPRATTSCDFLSAVMSVANVNWDAGDLDALRSVAGEIGCNGRR